ncbi:alpha-2-macroglobulin family protein [Oceanobacter mangrovi]|uniref:alpha-2-macroglobulin family protein n=1 Tax=Oceanobacter mangrovi TaxID=2862510 RepID=UPI001C8DA295|nr:MG2 domain-containing protein [Oceanobacter mangrovi]
MTRLTRSAAAILLTLGIYTGLAGCGENDSGPAAEPQLTEQTQTASPPAQPEASADQTAATTTASAPTAEPVEQPAAATTVADSQPAADAERYAGIPLTIARISEASYDGGSTVRIQLSVPLDDSITLEDYITVNSQKGKSWIKSADHRSLYMLGAEPQTSYRITVNAGLKGSNGSVLNSAAKAEVTTLAAPASLEFASDGRVLALSSQQGLPVISQNIAEANVSFFRVQDDQLQKIQRYLGRGTRTDLWSRDSLAKISDFKYEGRFKLTDERNRRRQINLPVRDIPQLSAPGIYLVVMQQPGTFDNQVATSWYSLTDLGLHLHQYGNRSELLVQSLETTQPIANASVELLDYEGASVQLGLTDQDGRLSIRKSMMDRYERAGTLVVRKGESVSLLSLSTSALDLSEFQFSQRPSRAQELFIYSPRDLYRGGETAEFSALLRGPDGKPIRVPKLQAVVTQPDGQRLTSISLATESAGYYHWSVALADDAMTGDWDVSVKLPDNSTSRYYFKVEDFMPERLKISWHPDATSSNANQHSGNGKLTVPVLGEYLYGAPASGNRFLASLNVKPELHPFDNWRDYSFADASETRWNSQDEQDSTLNDYGKLDLQISNSWSAASIPMAVTITGSLFESGGRPVVRRQKEIWLPAKQLVGVKPLFKDRAPSNGLAHFELVKTDGTEQLFDARQVNVRLINTNPDYDWRYNSDRGWYYERRDQATVELTLSVDLSSKQPTRIAVPVDWGDYRLEVENPDNGQTAVVDFESGYGWWGSYASEGNARPRQVSLAWDKAGYQAGDVARLTITPPAAAEQLPDQPSQAVVMIESDELLLLKRVELDNQGGHVDIPIDASWNRHDIYATVLYLQPADNQKRITPTRAVGLIHLPLDRQPRKLEISTNAPEKWLPDRQVTVELDISQQQQAVKQAWVTLAAVDVGVLSISRFETPDPFEFFFQPRRYDVDMFDLYNDVIAFNNSKPATLNFGGDADMARGGDMARSQVQIVSLFSGRVAVTNGKASVPLQLPDFNGRLRLMAVAFTDDAFGSLEQEVTVAAPVVTQLSMPRFAGMGDDSQIAFDITNLSGASQTLTVTPTATGPVEFSAQPQTLTLANQQKQTLVYPFKASYPQQASLGQIDFHITVDGVADYPIDRHWQLVSRPTLPAFTEFTRGRLSSQETLALDAAQLAGIDPRYVSTQVTLDSQVNLNPRRQLDDLLHYPYGCLEQSVSSSYPWLLVPQQQIDELNERSGKAFDRQQAMASGIQRVVRKMRSSGGFSLWSSSDDYEQHWLSAYATQFLIDAKNHGYNVDQPTIDKALNRLHDYVRGRGESSERWSNDSNAYRFAYRAYAAYVLALQQRISLSDVRKLTNGKPEHATPLSLVQLALAARQLGDNDLANGLIEQAKRSKRERYYYIGDYGSDIRDQAATAALLMENDYRRDWADDLLYQLETELRSRRYLSTQERIQLLKAAQLQPQSTQNWQVQLAFADQQIDLQGTQQQRYRTQDAAVLAGIELKNSGPESLSSEIAVRGYRELKTPRVNDNVYIERRYFTRKGEPITMGDQPLQMKTGDLMLVELRIRADKYRPDLLAVDLLPAGLELENQNLLDSQSIADIKIESTSIADWSSNNGVVHQEFRDDRFVAALATGDSYSSRIYYMVRAVTPGKYRIPGPLLEDMYDPEARSVGANSNWLIIE